ncbi:FAD-dependent oxidoreductase [Consotaella salsifontis]|uniref:Rieske [2Fe-2S] domain-containing protein n=1 Tax=Consotaella salsifontis TaxID=1365950 RepID=A0A1T4SQZ1_9HYPH|nr:FAD-dependent oxidoreductase [Consotaella salsifontis]SKA30576.1 Rieske [2Fe-2S] domain-containing protein [Consotaella salsifontis]
MSAKADDQRPDLAMGVASEAIPEGAILAGTVNEEPVVVARKGGHLFALSGKCTHLGAPLEKGILVGGELRCPWHHARFCLKRGAAKNAPALLPLASYEVSEVEGVVRVFAKRPLDSSEPESQGPGRVVIVGGGAAGHACADILARAGHGASVTIISSDADAPYDRTFCSKQFLAGKKEREDAMLPVMGLGNGPKPALRLKSTVARIDLGARAVILEGGEHVPFDSLVLATGAEPKRPELPGATSQNAFVLRSLSDAEAIIEKAGSAKSVAILGASFIGLEVAASMISRGLAVHVVAPGKVSFEKVMGAGVGGYVRDLHEKKGVVFHLGSKAESFDGGTLTLDDGSTIEADFVVFGVGVSPRIELAKQAGLAIASKEEGGGVKVDAELKTSAPGVYAVGDIASYPDARLGRRIRVEHWVHAERQGQHVARVLLGEAEHFNETPFFWTAHHGTSLRYVGHGDDVAEVRIDGSLEAGEFAAEIVEGERVSALVTLKRDRQALEREAEWDHAATLASGKS